MWQAKTSGTALLLCVATAAWAGVEPYPEAVMGQAVSTKTRAEVAAELRDAIHLGRMYDFPNLYSDKQARAEEIRQASVAATTASQPAGTEAGDVVIVWGDARLVRVKIQAEAAEANRLGLLAFGEGDPPVATAEQEQLIAAAGRRAISNFWIVGSL